MSQRIKAIEFVVGIIIISIIGLFLSYVYKFTSMKAMSSSSQITLNGVFSDVSGVHVGTEVKIGGVPVGEISEISIHEDLSIFVSIFTKSNLCIPQDSSLEVRTSGVLGSRYLEIRPGGLEECMKDNEYFENTKSALSLESLINKFLANQ